MDYQTILYEKTDGVGVVTIDRPEVLNALKGAGIALPTLPG